MASSLAIYYTPMHFMWGVKSGATPVTRCASTLIFQCINLWEVIKRLFLLVPFYLDFLLVHSQVNLCKLLTFLSKLGCSPLTSLYSGFSVFFFTLVLNLDFFSLSGFRYLQKYKHKIITTFHFAKPEPLHFKLHFISYT